MARIIGLNVAIPGNWLAANAAAATTELRQRPGTISRPFPIETLVLGSLRSSVWSFVGSAGGASNTRVMSWLSWLANSIVRLLFQSIQRIISIKSINFINEL